ncbi:MAG: hypothetical protein WCD53_15750 [Microcoleus sp.]
MFPFCEWIWTDYTINKLKTRYRAMSDRVAKMSGLEISRRQISSIAIVLFVPGGDIDSTLPLYL